jgi:transposase
MFHVRDTAFGPPTEPVHRIDSFSGLPKRRTFTPEEKSRLVAESFASDESVCAFARRHGLMPSQLFAWRKIARSGKSLGSNAKAAAATGQDDGPQPATIEIDLGAAVVRVSQGVDPATLKLVLQVLRDAA